MKEIKGACRECLELLVAWLPWDLCLHLHVALLEARNSSTPQPELTIAHWLLLPLLLEAQRGPQVGSRDQNWTFASGSNRHICLCPWTGSGGIEDTGLWKSLCPC